MIKVANLTKRFKTVTAVEDISFNIGESEIFAFLGPNGAGKTTTIRMLSTLISPTSGQVTIDGKNPADDGDYIRSIIGLLTETPGMYEKISAYDNLDYYASFYDIPAQRRRHNIEKYLKMFDLWKRKDDPAGTYSKGMKQKLALSRALVHEPRILFLDEPTAGLDPESAHMVRQFIDSLKHENTTVFLSTHNLEEASGLSDRVCIIKKKIIRIASLAELQGSSKSKRMEIVFSDGASKFLTLLEKIKQVSSVEIRDNRAFLVVDEPHQSNPFIIRSLVEKGADILYVNEIKASLEEIYLGLIKDEETR
ncbi:MAG: ABC transporter ATP-binding protein [Actinobacteria bacterium]|nr:ABC transporter ATP-binding protein [Actinomycetota bacterium]